MASLIEHPSLLHCYVLFGCQIVTNGGSQGRMVKVGALHQYNGEVNKAYLKQ